MKLNKKDEQIVIRMDKNLYKQLKRYADRNDDGLVSMSARRAIKLFLEESKEKSF